MSEAFRLADESRKDETPKKHIPTGRKDNKMYKFEVIAPNKEITYESDDKTLCLERLASALAYQYINKSAYIRRIDRRTNYDGTDTYTVHHDNGYKWRITVKTL